MKESCITLFFNYKKLIKYLGKHIFFIFFLKKRQLEINMMGLIYADVFQKKEKNVYAESEKF